MLFEYQKSRIVWKNCSRQHFPNMLPQACFATINYRKKFFHTDSDPKLGKNSVNEKDDGKPLAKKRISVRKAPVEITDLAKRFFLTALSSKPEAAGIMLKYQQHSGGEPRMVLSFEIVTSEEVQKLDEPVSLDKNLFLFIHASAFMKVLGCTVDFDRNRGLPVVFDKEGNELDPNF